MKAALPWALAGLLAATAAGCSKPVLRVADASLGDYYTEKEFSKLSREQRDDYCNELALQDSLYLDEIRESKTALAEVRARRASLGAEVDSLLAEADRREQNIRALLAARGGPDARPNPTPDDGHLRWSVRPGDSLWRISSHGEVYGNGAEWRRIYESNRGAVRDPDRIYPGQELSIPR
jgi:nucleoid-associated protein YgaU